MNKTKLSKKIFPAINSFILPSNYTAKLEKARNVLQKELSPRKLVTIQHCTLNSDSANVYYFENGFHAKHCKISYINLAVHVLEVYRSQQESDITLFDYVEDNLNAVCLNYLVSGKEIIEL